MKFTIVGDWYDCWDLASTFAVVTEGETLDEAKQNAAEAVLEHFPHRAEGEAGETPETLWGGDNGAYVVAAFEGDLSTQALESATFELIA
ncbi:hypothetical protein J7E93_06355 [Streptomyces sp. ISL-36]|uniref:hypothetical protein n=1 Tax=Streptomyces sp. ISL-36 TaxID=2819182 RepID=UPI001BE7F279|nr:hypothetical protein [Streptomyces sp. ISL-36]MBT2439748.1 hypothetical protein [Streptomyces sp. ISL-36]